MAKCWKKSALTGWIVLCVCLAVIAGCSGKSVMAGGSSGASAKKKGDRPTYYDFGDVLIPKEVKVLKKTSFVYTTGGVSFGVLSLKGYVDFHSLITFFETNMAKDNWKEVGAFKSRRTVLLFSKETRWCVINITDKMTKTEVEIWVAPSTGQTEVGLIKD